MENREKLIQWASDWLKNGESPKKLKKDLMGMDLTESEANEILTEAKLMNKVEDRGEEAEKAQNFKNLFKGIPLFVIGLIIGYYTFFCSEFRWRNFIIALGLIVSGTLLMCNIDLKSDKD